MSVRPRPALLAALAVAVLLNVITRSSGITWLALGSAAALALPLTSLVIRPRLQDLEIVLLLPARVVAGDLTHGELRVRNGGLAPSAACRWRLDHPALGVLDISVPGLTAGGTTSFTVEATAAKRGVHRGCTAAVSTAAPYGMVLWTRVLQSDDHVLIVHPVTGATRALRAEGAPTAADRSIPLAGGAAEVLGLRPWQQGDSARHVSARATARHGRPVVLERERETGPSLVLLASAGAGSTWEQAVSTAASLCLSALRDGRPPVVVADPPPYRRDALGLLDFFAGVDGTGPLRPEDIRAALTAAGRGGTLVLLGQHEQVRSAAAAAGVRLEVLS